MKKTIKFIVLMLIFIIISIIGSYKLFISLNNFEENKLYSEKMLLNNKTEEENTDYITREMAIEKALNLFKVGFGLDLNRDKLSESIDLYEIKSGGYKWHIVWSENNDKNLQQFFCDILAEDGKIIGIGINDFSLNNDFLEKDTIIKTNNDEINNDEINKIINPLAKELNLNLNDFEKIIVLKNTSNLGVSYLNSKSKKLVYEFGINYKEKKLNHFYYYLN